MVGSARNERFAANMEAAAQKAADKCGYVKCDDKYEQARERRNAAHCCEIGALRAKYMHLYDKVFPEGKPSVPDAVAAVLDAVSTLQDMGWEFAQVAEAIQSGAEDDMEKCAAEVRDALGKLSLMMIGLSRDPAVEDEPVKAQA